MSTSWPPSPTFWTDEFPAQTTNRTTPHLFKGIVPASAASPADVLTGFASIRRAHAAESAIGAKARVYVGEDRRDDLLPTVLGAQEWREGEFVEWMQSLAGADRFSLVINNLETVSPPLAASLGAFLGSLFEGWGFPVGGAEQVAFAGNYAGTAFGVHEGYEDAFLIHLGPNPKNFYTWSAEEYEKLTGGKQALLGDYKWLLEHGEHFLLEPGDALFLPRRVFHVGTQDQFSVSVAVPLYTHPDAGILRKDILPDLLTSLLLGDGPDDDRNQPSPMAPAGDGGPVAQRLAARGRATLATAIDRLEEATEQHVQQRWDTVLSNGGWEFSEGDFARTEAAAAFTPQQVTPGATVTLIAPYRLRVGPDRVLLRGLQADLAPAALSPDLIEALNSGTAFTLPEDQNVLAAVRALGATGGIHLTARSTNTEATAS